ncbi:hypothetical protein ACIRPU_12415 [Streptomyces sp. NPDC102259]|uniref:hypothetical protein n=1 Tax=Streptomyces sp. NPDC102259 TaxID=3366148 RepID=UPI003830B0EF
MTALDAALAGGVQLVDTPGPPPRPARPPGYWERIDRIVSQAPPLSDEQKAVIRTAFSTVSLNSISTVDESREAA